MTNTSDYPYEEVTFYDDNYAFEVPVSDLIKILGTSGSNIFVRGNMKYEADPE